MKLIGVDVGFSKTRETTGIACVDGEKLYLDRAGTEWNSRREKVPPSFQAPVIALDGPLLPASADGLVRRSCEYAFIQAPFHNRCKPGLSHFGTGLKLRRAAAEACTQFGEFVSFPAPSKRGVRVSRRGPIVEAFPNAFLGVLLPESRFPAPKLKRGHRFDWLYGQALEAGRLEPDFLGLDLPDEVWRRLKEERNHELRAALICLLTAAFAVHQTAAVIGESAGGWFWLPPYSLWEPWAKCGLAKAAEEIAERVHSRLDVYQCD
jgi:hypothetical protein